MPSVRLIERVSRPFTGVVVNREAGTIGNVLVCGFDSLNGRDYPPAVLGKAIGLYEGRPVNCDHASQATVERRLGWLTQPQAGPDGKPRATLNVLKSHPLADRVFEAAERNPALFGLSHVALCRTRRENGREVVEAIESVESVDLVADPATTKGLHEGRAVRIKLLKLVEWLAPRVTVDQLLRVKRLAEMDGMGDLDVADPTAPDAGSADPDDAIDSAFKAAMAAVVDAYPDHLDAAGVLAKLKDLLKAHGKVGDGGSGEAESDESPSKESNTNPASDLTREALDVCRKVGFRGFDADDLDTIAAAAPPRREAVARRLMGAATPAKTPPRSAGREAAAGLTVATEQADKTAPPEKADDFHKWLAESVN